MPFATNTQDESRVYFEDDGGDGTPIVILGGFLDPIELVRSRADRTGPAGAHR